MGCCFELALAAWGVYLISTGEFKMPGAKRPITGTTVRLAGIVFAMPLPLAFLIGFAIGFSQGLRGRSLGKDSMPMLMLMEFGILFACFVIGGLMIAYASFNQPPRRDEEDDGFSRRRNIDFDEVFETHGRLPAPTAPYRGEHADGVIPDRPVLPPPLPRDASFDSEPPRRRERAPTKANDTKQTLVVMVMAVVLFFAVAGVGAVIMWPK